MRNDYQPEMDIVIYETFGFCFEEEDQSAYIYMKNICIVLGRCMLLLLLLFFRVFNIVKVCVCKLRSQCGMGLLASI